VFVESLLCALPAPFIHRSVMCDSHVDITRNIVTALLLSSWSQQQHQLVSWHWGTTVIHWLSFFCIFASFALADSPTQVVLCLLIWLLIGWFSTWLVRRLANLIFWRICHMACLLLWIGWFGSVCFKLCCIERNCTIGYPYITYVFAATLWLLKVYLVLGIPCCTLCVKSVSYPAFYLHTL